MTVIEIPLHLQKAADNHLTRMISAGVLEPQTKVTDWTARAFFLPKPGCPEEARLVVDFSWLNQAFSRPGHPFDSSSTILKRLNPDDKLYISVDRTEGYHQVPVHKTTDSI